MIPLSANDRFRARNPALSESNTASRGLVFEAGAVIRVEPVESARLLRVQTEFGTVLNEVSALFRILHHAAGFQLIRPGFDFSRGLGRAVCQQPRPDVLIIFRGLDRGLELVAVDALETEEHVVQRAIVVIFAQLPGHAGTALVSGTAGNDKAGVAIARAVRSLFGQVSVDNGSIHKFNLFVLSDGVTVIAQPLGVYPVNT